MVPPPLITLTAFWRVGFWCSHLWCGLVGVCGGSACPMGGGRSGRGGTIVSRPYVLLVSLPPLRCVQEKGWGALVVC